MSRHVPTALQAHLNQPATTTCRLLKIKLKSGTVFGLAALDIDVPYDDASGDGEITYTAGNSFDPSTFSADTGFSVSNAEAQALLAGAVPGVTAEMVAAGDLDDAEWACYLVNFMDLSMGHAILDAGDVGDVTTNHGMLWIPELLSYAMRLKQPIGAVDSLSCRAIFGSDADSQTGCGIDVAPLWVMGEVLAIGAETDRVFTGDEVTGIGQPMPYPGRVQFLTGNNAGRELSTEQIDGEVVHLSETTPFPIEVGDTYRIRPDCGKRFAEDCIAIWHNGPNFKGEPHIPVGDDAAIQTPGAQTPKKQIYGSLG